MHTTTIDGHSYQISKASAREGLRLLRGWCDVEADRQEAMGAAYAASAKRLSEGVHPLAGEDPSQAYRNAEAFHINGQMHAINAADYRTRAAYMLTDDRVRDLILPTLALATVHTGGMIAEVSDVWDHHFAGRIGALFDLLDAIRDHNFADFFAVSATSGAETQAAPETAAQTQEAPSTGGSGRPSVRATARSAK